MSSWFRGERWKKSQGFGLPLLPPPSSGLLGMGQAVLLYPHRPQHRCLAGWKLLICGVNLQIRRCVNALHSWDQTAPPRSRGVQIGITGFVCVFSGKGKLTAWMKPKEWGGWQSLYMCWGLIWLEPLCKVHFGSRKMQREALSELETVR